MERVLSDNGGVYRSHLWRNTCNELGIKHKRTRPYRPQTNSKIELFHRTLADGWAYRPLLHLRGGAPWQARRLAALLQPPPAPPGLREPATLLTIDQHPRSVHLAVNVQVVTHADDAPTTT